MGVHRALLIEEVGLGRKTLTHHLRLSGIEADGVDNADKALELLKTSHYTLCIIDLTLPTMEGWRALQNIRKQTALTELPCIAIAPFADSWMQQKILQLGFTTYIYRQSTASLVQQIRSVVQKHWNAPQAGFHGTSSA